MTTDDNLMNEKQAPTSIQRRQAFAARRGARPQVRVEDAGSWEDAIDELLAAYLPELNAAIPDLIVSSDLDPWKKVLSDDYTLGSINLGICTAKVKASYSITDMTGLATLLIDTAVVETIDVTDPDNITGTLSMTAELTDKLKAKVGGKVKASCGVISESVGINGSVKATSVTGKATADFTASVGATICLNSCKVTKFSLSYKDIKVEIDGLGIFNQFLGPLVDLINELFGDAIKGGIAGALKPVLNDLLKSELPYCYEL